MGAAAHTQMQVRLRQTKILKKNIGHVQVIMLAGVHNQGFGPWLLFEGMVERRNFHKIRSGG